MKNAFTIALMILLAAPQFAAAAPWIAESMSDTVHVQLSDSSMVGFAGQDSRQHSVHPVHDHGQNPQVPGSHDSMDCDEDCSSCSNHCSSTAATSTPRSYPDPHFLPARAKSGFTVTRTSSLFRPPIRG